MADETYNLKITKRVPIPPDSGKPYSPWSGVFGPRKEPTMAARQIHMIALKDHLSNDGRRLRGDPTGEDGAPYILHSEMEAAQHVQLGLGKRVSPAAKEGGEDEGAEPSVDAPWTLGVPPEQYLQKWPQGPNAEQARAILAKKEAAKDSTTTAKPAAPHQPATVQVQPAPGTPSPSGPRPVS